VALTPDIKVYTRTFAIANVYISLAHLDIFFEHLLKTRCSIVVHILDKLNEKQALKFQDDLLYFWCASHIF